MLSSIKQELGQSWVATGANYLLTLVTTALHPTEDSDGKQLTSKIPRASKQYPTGQLRCLNKDSAVRGRKQHVTGIGKSVSLCFSIQLNPAGWEDPDEVSQAEVTPSSKALRLDSSWHTAGKEAGRLEWLPQGSPGRE